MAKSIGRASSTCYVVGLSFLVCMMIELFLPQVEAVKMVVDAGFVVAVALGLLLDIAARWRRRIELRPS